MSEENNELVVLKAQMLDLLLDMKRDARQASMVSQSWRDALVKIIDLLELESPTFDEIFAKITILMKAYSKPKQPPGDIPVDRAGSVRDAKEEK